MSKDKEGKSREEREGAGRTYPTRRCGLQRKKEGSGTGKEREGSQVKVRFSKIK